MLCAEEGGALRCNDRGNIAGLSVNGAWLPVRVRLAAASPGWTNVAYYGCGVRPARLAPCPCGRQPRLTFCFGLDTGAAEMTRRLLRPPVARVRMHLDALPPPGGPVSHATLMSALVAADRPWNELWQSLAMDAALRKQGASILIGSWRMPAWLLDAPPRHDRNRVTTTQGRLCVPRSGIRVRDGQADITLAGASLTTLTTLPLLPHDIGGRQRL